MTIRPDPLDTEDLWRRIPDREAVELFSTSAGVPAKNVIGLGDPDVHCIDGQWVMYLGGFTTRFANRLFEARLPQGAPLSSPDWTLVTEPDRAGTARILVPAGSWRSWDRWGMHTPSFARGTGADGASVERIYYTGRRTFRQSGPKSRYAIGVAERVGDDWKRHDAPVLEGDHHRPSAYEPLVRFDDGLWRMWYQSTPGEVQKGEQPDYEIRYVESRDGLTGWSRPLTVFTQQDCFFDNAVIKAEDRWEMVLARGTNLHGTTPFPAQGLWWACAQDTPGVRRSWSSQPVRLVNADIDPEPWFTRGFFGPAMQYGDSAEDHDDLYVFATGTSAAPPWFPTALQRLKLRRRPPMPMPFALTVGRLQFPNARARLPTLEQRPLSPR